MELHDAINRACNAKSSADSWINFFNALDILLAVVLIPFTMGLSLLLLLSIPILSAIGSIATSCKRTSELTLIQTQMMSDQRQ